MANSQPKLQHLVPFNIPTITGAEQQMMERLYQNPSYFRQRHFHNSCKTMLSQWYQSSKILLTTSCTHALELALSLMHFQEGDEVIVPSFTYVSTAIAIVNAGATPVFVDIDPSTLNLDISLLPEAITNETKAIIPVHYGGIGCDMQEIQTIAGSEIAVIEDAAHSLLAEYNNQFLGTFGTFGCISFDYTKNISCGHGGMLLINDPLYVESAEIAYEIGTDKAKFIRGEKSFFEWVAPGSKYALSELNAAHLYAQLQHADNINQQRLIAWQYYYNELSASPASDHFRLLQIPEQAHHQGHIFGLITSDAEERKALLQYLKDGGIEATFHYIPLHNSHYGQHIGRFVHREQEEDHTTSISKCLLRLPIYHGITRKEQDKVMERIEAFYKNK